MIEKELIDQAYELSTKLLGRYSESAHAPEGSVKKLSEKKEHEVFNLSFKLFEFYKGYIA